MTILVFSHGNLWHMYTCNLTEICDPHLIRDPCEICDHGKFQPTRNMWPKIDTWPICEICDPSEIHDSLEIWLDTNCVKLIMVIKCCALCFVQWTVHHHVLHALLLLLFFLLFLTFKVFTVLWALFCCFCFVWALFCCYCFVATVLWHLFVGLKLLELFC